MAVGQILISPVGWVLVLGIPVLLFRHAVYWLRRFLFTSWTVPLSWRDPAWLLLWLLLSYFALNFLNVVRPFPIGWDDLGSYLNRPRLLISYGHFIHSMASFQWEYLTSLGFLLFGYDSTFGTIASLMVNWMAGILAVLAIFAFLRVFLGGGGLLAALLYYTLPLVGHFSFADMKVDNAVFAMGTYSVLALFFSLFSPSAAMEEHQRHRWIIVSGAFAGFAFGMKPTAVMGIFALVPILLGMTVHWWAAVPTSLFVFGLYIWRNVINSAGIFARLGWEEVIVSRKALALWIWVIGLLLLLPILHSLWRTWRVLLLRLAFFGGAAALVVLPWMWYNSILNGSVLPHVALGAPNTLVPAFDVAGGSPQGASGIVVRSLPPDLAVDITNANCSSPTGTKEEIDRYWGFRQGLGHYIALPWRSVLNIDSAGYYVTTMPSLLLFPLLLLLP
ncbi:glycosyltransferase family 39 protein, partial [Candidatus Peregrinibacteria bacterium]|nr:glycosyltransferase family 39 protein [Candidatus Peregrinibacteria bacterium]